MLILMRLSRILKQAYEKTLIKNLYDNRHYNNSNNAFRLIQGV